MGTLHILGPKPYHVDQILRNGDRVLVRATACGLLKEQTENRIQDGKNMNVGSLSECFASLVIDIKYFTKIGTCKAAIFNCVYENLMYLLITAYYVRYQTSKFLLSFYFLLHVA